MRKYLSLVISLVLIVAVVGCALPGATTEEARGASPVYKGSVLVGAGKWFKMQSGADMTVYSDIGVTEVFTMDGATGDIWTDGSISAGEIISQSITVAAADDLTSVDDALIGDDAVIAGALSVGETSNFTGNISDDNSALTVADNMLVDGAADVVQMTVQGFSTQTTMPFVVENSAGTDQFTVSNTGNVAALGSVALTQVNVASAGANPFDYTGTLGIMNGSDAFEAIDVNITNANHTGTAATNTVRALDVAGITADAEAYESAIYLGAGWDNDVNGATSLELASDDVVVVTVKDPAGADSAATNEMVEIAGTTPVDTTGTNVHDFLTIDAAIGNSSAGTNSVVGLQIDGITGDAQVTETAINVVTGWDVGLAVDAPVTVGGGYGATGCSVSAAGALSCDDAVIAGGGYADTGCTMSAGGILQCAGAGTLDGALTADSGSFGGGYAGSGAAISNAGVGEFNGALTTDGALTAASGVFGGGYGSTGATVAATGAISADNDVTLSADATGGNAGAKNEFIGLPRIKLAGVGVKDGTALVQVDDSPAAEWTGTAHVVDTADTAVYKVGANSLKLVFAADAVATNGALNPGPTGDWTGFQSIGFWVYADKTFTAAQLDIYLTDVTDAATFNTCAYTVANVWQYCEVDITSLAGTQGDDVTDITVRMAAGLPVPINIYIDNMVVWAAADEVSLGVAVQQDGDLGFINALTGAQLDPSVDYTIAWRSGIDYVVVVADMDPDGMFGMVAY
jgi:hypothetical protein